jgi:hypothetical protein
MFMSTDIQCGPPPAVPNAMVVNDTGIYTPGTIIGYSCNSGYVLEVEDSVVVVDQEGVVESVCDAQGRWHLVPICTGTA